MSWFFNLKLKHKLAFIFSIMVFTISFLGYFSISQLDRLNSNSENIKDKWLLSTKILGDINSDISNFRLAELSHILSNSPEKMRIFEQNMQKHIDLIDRSKELLEPLIYSDLKELLYGDLKREWRRYLGKNREVIALSRANKKDKALTLIRTGSQYDFTTVKETLTKLIELNLKGVEKANANSYETYKNSNNLITITIFTIIFIFLFFGFFITNTISKSISTIQNSFLSFCQFLNRDSESIKPIEIKYKDEFGLIASTLNANISKIKESISKDTEILKSVSNGNYSVKMRIKGKHDSLSILTNEIIDNLKTTITQANEIANGNFVETIEPKHSKDELGFAISNMTKAIIENKRKNDAQNWLKDGLNRLNRELIGDYELVDLSKRAIDFVAIYSKSSVGVLYIYDSVLGVLKEYSNYAYSKREKLNNEFKLGEGVVGQVALQQSEIHLTTINRCDIEIVSATTIKVPKNTFTYPLIYKENLLGVIEVGSLKDFEDIEIEFLNSSSDIISNYIYSAIQSRKIKNLLEDSQKTNEFLKEQSEELKNTNEQILTQQKELEEANLQLEEQQEMLEDSTKELKDKNEILLKSKRELDARALELELANKYKSEFLANMSHELRTPLNSIIMLSKNLSTQKSFDEDYQKKINVINQSGNELFKLINDILDLSKIEAGQMSLNPKELNLSKFINSFQGSFEQIAKEKKLDFAIETLDDIYLYIDESRLTQIINNLLSNAFKFTKRGAVNLKISKNQNEAYPIKIEVIDSGIGIKEEKIDIIFEAFKQLNTSLDKEFSGTGLGLSICKKISNLMGINILVSSKVDSGSRFTLEIPKDTILEKREKQKERKNLLIADDIELDNSKKTSNETIFSDLESKLYKILIIDIEKFDIEKIINFIDSKNIKINTIIHTKKNLSQNEIDYLKKITDTIICKNENSKERVTEEIEYYLNKNSPFESIINGKNILIVDDDSKNIFTLSQSLSVYDANISTAYSALEALEILDKKEIDIVLMDIMMPIIDGYECIKRIRASEKLKDIPIIAVTAKAMPEDRKNAIEAGANDYISKPIDFDILTQMIKAWLNR